MRSKYLRMLLAFTATSALAAIGATTAAAYPNPRFEPSIPPATIYYGIQSGQVTLETNYTKSKYVYEIVCASASGEGEIREAFGTYRSYERALTFKECKMPKFANVKCTGTSNSTAGEITANKMEWDLAILNKEKEEAGLVMNENPAKPESGLTFATFHCAGVGNYTLSGSTLGKITPVGSSWEPVFHIAMAGLRGEPELSKYIREPESETEKRYEGKTSLTLTGIGGGTADLSFTNLEMSVLAWRIVF